MLLRDSGSDVGGAADVLGSDTGLVQRLLKSAQIWRRRQLRGFLWGQICTHAPPTSGDTNVRGITRVGVRELFVRR